MSCSIPSTPKFITSEIETLLPYSILKEKTFFINLSLKVFFIKNTLRERLMKKVFSFKMEYGSKVSISEVMNLGVEGIEQLNLFYSALLPQLLFSLIGPVILFIILSKTKQQYHFFMFHVKHITHSIN